MKFTCRCCENNKPILNVLVEQKDGTKMIGNYCPQCVSVIVAMEALKNKRVLISRFPYDYLENQCLTN